jgi:hypothetical protein
MFPTPSVPSPPSTRSGALAHPLVPILLFPSGCWPWVVHGLSLDWPLVRIFVTWDGLRMLNIILDGYNIMKVLGNRLTLMSPSRGFSMELGSAITVVLASQCKSFSPSDESLVLTKHHRWYPSLDNHVHCRCHLGSRPLQRRSQSLQLARSRLDLPRLGSHCPCRRHTCGMSNGHPAECPTLLG